MKYLILICAVGMAFGCGRGEIAMACPDEVDTLVLREMASQMGNWGLGSLPQALSNYPKEFLDAQQKKLNGIKEWSKSLRDPCAMKAYSRWIDYYQHELNESYGELRTHAERKSMDDYRRERDEETQRVELYKSKHGIPSPPVQD